MTVLFNKLENLSLFSSVVIFRSSYVSNEILKSIFDETYTRDFPFIRIYFHTCVFDLFFWGDGL